MRLLQMVEFIVILKVQKKTNKNVKQVTFFESHDL